MKYGGHQTFTIREGWLYKGLSLLIDEERRKQLVDDYAMDFLGVGRNMAKSINHWLLATNLAEKRQELNNKGKKVEKKDIEPTKFAELVNKYDPYFMDEGTWWFLHINMINNPQHGATWHWFFNNFGQDRFQRQVCLSNLERYENFAPGKNMARTRTILYSLE